MHIRSHTQNISHVLETGSVKTMSLKSSRNSIWIQKSRTELDRNDQYDFPQCIKLPQPRKRPKIAALPTVV